MERSFAKSLRSILFFAAVFVSGLWALWFSHRMEIEAVRKEALAHAGTLFLGDSLTERWPAESLARVAPLGDHHHPPINRGIGGETSAELRARFAFELDRARPVAVALLTGTNDLYLDHRAEPLVAETVILENLSAMIELAETRGLAVIVGTLPPVAVRPGGDLGGLSQERIDRVNRGIRALAIEHHVLLSDYAAALAPAIVESAKDPEALLEADGIHLTKAGYERMEIALHVALTGTVPANVVSTLSARRVSTWEDSSANEIWRVEDLTKTEWKIVLGEDCIAVPKLQEPIREILVVCEGDEAYPSAGGHAPEEHPPR